MSPALDFLVRLGGLSAVVAMLWAASWVWAFLGHPRFDRFYGRASAIAGAVAECVAAVVRLVAGLVAGIVGLVLLLIGFLVWMDAPTPMWRCGTMVSEMVRGTTYTYCGD